MIINATSNAFNNLSPAPVHGKHSKSRSQAADTDTTDTTADQLSISSENLVAANPPLKDVDAVVASLKTAVQSILGQPSLAKLAQAGSLAQSAVQLLQD
jgi:flagellin-like hook-associated protein FlgL